MADTNRPRPGLPLWLPKAKSPKVCGITQSSMLRPQMPSRSLDIVCDSTRVGCRYVPDCDGTPQDVDGINDASSAKRRPSSGKVVRAVIVCRKVAASLFCEVDRLSLTKVSGRWLPPIVQPHLKPVDRSKVSRIWCGRRAEPCLSQHSGAVQLTGPRRRRNLVMDFVGPTRFGPVPMLSFQDGQRVASGKVSKGDGVVEYWRHV